MPPPSSSRSPSPPWQPIGYLTIRTDETRTKEWEQLPPESTRYRVVRDLIDLGLQVLETPKGRETLAHIGQKLVKTRNEKKKPDRHIYDQPLSDMPFWVDTFLRKLRADFPTVSLCLPDGEAAVTKKEWQMKHPRMSDYDPKVAAIMSVSKVIINDIIWASQQPDKELSKQAGAVLRFQMIVTLAHEITHLLTGFLTGAARPLTPPTIGLKGWTQGKTGEAGRYWESIMLGGVVEFYHDVDHEWGTRQPGIPWLMRTGDPKSQAWKVDINYIHRFVKGDFSFPVGVEKGYRLPIPEMDPEKEAKRLADRKARHDAKREAHFRSEAELDRQTRRTRRTAPRVEFNSDSEDSGDDVRALLRERCDEMTLIRPRNVNTIPATTSPPRIRLANPDPGEPSASTAAAGGRSRSGSPNTAVRDRRLPDDFYGRAAGYPSSGGSSSRADANPFAPRDAYTGGSTSSARLEPSAANRGRSYARDAGDYSGRDRYESERVASRSPASRAGSYGGGSSSRANPNPSPNPSPNPFAPRDDYAGGSASSARLGTSPANRAGSYARDSDAYSGRDRYESERVPGTASRSESSPPRNPFASQAFPIRTGTSTSRGAYAGASSGRTAAPVQSNPFAPIQSNPLATGGPARTAPYIPTDPYADGAYGQQGYPQQGAYDAGRSYGSYSGDRQYR